MLTVFDIDHSTGADMYDFQQICPAFIQQVTSEACKANQSHKSNSTPKKTEKNFGKSKLLSIHFSAVNMYYRVKCTLYMQVVHFVWRGVGLHGISVRVY